MNATALSPYGRTSRCQVNVSVRQLVASDLTAQAAEGGPIVGTLLSKWRGPERERSCEAFEIFAIGCTGCIFLLGYSMGYPRCLYRSSYDRTFYTVCEQHPSTYWIAKLLSSSSAASTRDGV